jgi:hypothetical protein
MFGRALQFGGEAPMGDDDDADHLCLAFRSPWSRVALIAA